VEAPAAGKAEGLFHDATAGLLDLRHRVIEPPRVEDHQGTSRANVCVLAKATDFAALPLDAGVIGTVVVERPSERGAIEALRLGYVRHRDLDVVDCVVNMRCGV